MEIMKLIPTGKDYLWGGTRLREEYGKQIDLTPFGGDMGMLCTSGWSQLCGEWNL